ncbi:hypothetical protein HWV62_21646 [Athelia sp. TMB]|nr:hypothetical protein HWV62_21646 [Athelia sp. TMB]
MPNKRTAVWQLFDRDGTHFGRNKTHFNAWCHGCLKNWIAGATGDDVMISVEGSQSRRRTEGEMKDRARQVLTPVLGKVNVMKNHAHGCPYLAPVVFGSNLCERVFEQMQMEMQANKENILPSTPVPSPQPSVSSPLKRAQSFATDSSFSSASSGSRGQWTAKQQEEFAIDFCKLLVATDTSWNFANNPQTHRFFAKYRPEAAIPNRRVLSGHILDKISADEEAKITD